MRCGFCATVMDIVVGVWCDKKGVVTSPCTWRYNNEALGGVVANELTLEKKPKKWQQVGSLLAHRHLPHLRKKTRNDDEPRDLASSFACHHLLYLKKQKDDNELRRLAIIYYIWNKNKGMMTSQGGSPSSVTLEKKNKEMMTN
jgi:hypothetical protein